MTHASQRIPPAPSLFAQGRQITVRQVRADDIDLLTSFHTRLSARTCQQRYLAARSFSLELAHAEATRIAAARTRQHIALVASAPLFGIEDLVGVAELARLPGEHGVGELAVAVRDDLQGSGIGSLLVRAVAVSASQLGIGTLHIELLAENSAMRRLAAHVGELVVVGRTDGVLQLRVKLHTPAAAGEGQESSKRRGPGAPRRAA
jgi:RimJ/RimL family protein N-acetyltransferase